MTLRPEGNVGIGTTNPSQKLDVSGNTNISEILKIGNTTAGAFNSVIRLQVYGGDNSGTVVIFKHPNDTQGLGIRYNEIFQTNSTNDSFNITSVGNGGLRFNTGGENRMNIASNGDVGIQGSGYAIPNNFMDAGSLSIGNQNQNYGGGTSSWNSSIAGLLMECLDTTEIAIHDSGNVIHFIYVV